MQATVIVRPASDADVPAITDIYNEAILHTTATMDTDPKTIDDRRAWFGAHDAKHPILVAQVGGRVVGWASLSAWSDRCAYETTLEESVYVAPDMRGRGVGKRLLQELLPLGPKVGAHTLVARITADNPVSLKLHRDLGFEDAGCLRQVGKKFGRWIDVCQLQYFCGPKEDS